MANVTNAANVANSENKKKKTNNFSSYEKIIQSMVTLIHHIVRIKINSSVADMIDIVKNIPENAVLVEAFEEDDYCELVFQEEKSKK